MDDKTPAKRQMSERQHHLAMTAFHEIAQTCEVLLTEVYRVNDAASVPSLVASGLLRRISLLADAASECVDQGDGWNDALLSDIIEYGRSAVPDGLEGVRNYVSREEASHE